MINEISKFLPYQFKTEHELIQSIQELSQGFIERRLKGEGYFENPRLLSAYTLFYFTTNFHKITHAMEMAGLTDLSEFDQIVDIGTGPGSSLFPLREKFVGKLVGVDISQSVLKTARLLAEHFEAGAVEFYHHQDLPAPSGHVLLIFSHSFNEMGKKAAQKYLDHFRPKAIFFMEPGTKDVFKKLTDFRPSLIDEGFYFHYPCPKSLKTCPVANKDDWCHQYLELSHHPEVERLCQKVKLNRRLLPQTLWYLRKDEKTRSENYLFRTFGAQKFGVKTQWCELEGEGLIITEKTLLKKEYSKSDFKKIKQLKAGQKLS